LHQEEVVEAGPVMQDIQRPVEVSDVASPPRQGHRQNQQTKIFVMVPMKAGAQGVKELIQRGGNAYDAKHGGNSPSAGGEREIHTLSSHRLRIASCAPICQGLTPILLEKVSQHEDFLPEGETDADRVEMVWELLRRHGEDVRLGFRNMQANHSDPFEPFPTNSLLALVASGEHVKPEVRRLAESIRQMVKVAIGEMFAHNRPSDEPDMNRKLAALLRTHEPDLRSEHPTKSFACARVVPDHVLESADLLVEGKYIRQGTPPSKATEGIAADLTKYPLDAFILFVVYDPDHAISSDQQYRKDIETKGRNIVVIVR
jgi:hypothetical protein